MEQLNIEGKRSGEGFVCHKERLVNGLSRAQAPKVRIGDVDLGRKGFLTYLRALGGSNIVKISPYGCDCDAEATHKYLRVVCGSNTSHLADSTWVADEMAVLPSCEVRVSPTTFVQPNVGGIELADALSRVIPFIAGKADARPVLACIRFAQKDGKLTLTAADGYRLAEVSLDFEDGEGEALIPASDIKGLTSALKKAHRVRLAFEPNGVTDHNALVIDTEAIRYKWGSEQGRFPDTDKLFPSVFTAVARFDTREMLRAASSLASLTVDTEAAISISVKDGALQMTAREEVGEARIEGEGEGEAQTAINGAYLISGLKALWGIAEIHVNTPSDPVLFTVDGYRLVVMPMAIQAKAVAEAEAVAQKVADKPKRKRRRKADEPVDAPADAVEEPADAVVDDDGVELPPDVPVEPVDAPVDPVPVEA